MWLDQRGSEILRMPECLRLLALSSKKGLVGRLAVSQQQAPLLQPVNFAFHDREVVVRLGPGSLADAATGALVAFEVDHVDRAAGHAWSVLVRGLATPLVETERPDTSYVVPTPLVPAPGDIVLTVRLDVVTGRRFALKQGMPDNVGVIARGSPRGMVGPVSRTERKGTG